jgi:hypothetical protein
MMNRRSIIKALPFLTMGGWAAKAAAAPDVVRPVIEPPPLVVTFDWMQPDWMARYCYQFVQEFDALWGGPDQLDGMTQVAFIIKDGEKFEGFDHFAQKYLRPCVHALLRGSRRDGHHTRSEFKIVMYYSIQKMGTIVSLYLPDDKTKFSVHDLAGGHNAFFSGRENDGARWYSVKMKPKGWYQ